MSTAPSTTTPIDTRDMVVIHTFLRREFRLAGGLVRRVQPGDTSRAGVVADHLVYLGWFLHHHHTLEDELVWPKLLDRVPEELAPIVKLMEAQHEGVDALLEQIGALLTGWRATAAADVRDELSGLYDELYAGLAEHLDAEEQRVLPLAVQCLTVEEWDELGEQGRNRTNKSDMALTLGMFIYEGDPEVIANMLAKAPLPVRIIVPRLAKRAFRKHALKVHGTATP
jgi:hemerythrin-like domain-containing protein